MKSFVCTLIFFTTCVLLATHPILGETADREELPVFDLGQIDVVGEAIPPETAATETVTASDMADAMLEDLPMAINRIPGINTTVGSKNETQFMIRGLYQERVLVIMDGIPMAAPYYGDLDAAEIPLDNLQEIKVVRGNASVLYGPNAMGGVVSLVSPKPENRPNLHLFTTIDQEGNVVGRLGHGNRFGHLYYQLSAGIRESDGWVLSDDFETVTNEDNEILEDGDVRKNSQFSQWSGAFKVGGEWDNSELSLSANYIDAEKGIPPTVDPDDRARYRKFPEWKKATITAAGRKAFGDTVELRANVFYHKYDNVLQDYKDPDYTSLKWESTYDDYSTGLNSRLSWVVNDKWTLRAALHAIRDNHKSQGDIGDIWEEYQADTYSVAAQSDWQLSDIFALQMGVSYDIYDFDSVNNVEGSSSSIANRTQDVDDFTGSLVAEWLLADSHKINVAASRKLQLPTMSQLFGNIEEIEPADVTTLDPETAMEYAVGYEYLATDDVQFGATAYYYDIDDMIVRPDRDGLYINLDSAEIKGIECWAAYEPATGFNGSISYTFTDAEEDSSIYGEREMEFVPESMIHADAGYIFGSGTSLNLGLTWRDEVTDYDQDIARIVPDYTLLDATIRHNFDFGLGLQLKVSNLTDEDYYQEIGFPLAGRTILFGLTFNL